jgi:hypothetical protein
MVAEGMVAGAGDFMVAAGLRVTVEVACAWVRLALVLRGR